MNLLKNFSGTYEFRRKTVHFILGIFFVIFINLEVYFVKSYLELILLAFLIIAVSLSIYCKYKKPKMIMFFLELFDKPKDLEKFPGKGAVYYLIGAFISILLFDRRIASAAILILAVGDPMAHLFGRYYGKRKLIINEKKLLEGTLGGTFLATIAASFFVPWPIAFFGAAFGMMAEAVELEFLNLDDNFFIPFVSGGVIKIIQLLL